MLSHTALLTMMPWWRDGLERDRAGEQEQKKKGEYRIRTKRGSLRYFFTLLQSVGLKETAWQLRGGGGKEKTNN